MWRSDKALALTSDYVFDETVTVVKLRAGHQAAVAAGNAMLSSPRVTVEPVSDDDRRAAWQIFMRHRDKSWSFTDCTSKVLIDRLSCQEVWALDLDVRQMGYRLRP